MKVIRFISCRHYSLHFWHTLQLINGLELDFDWFCFMDKRVIGRSVRSSLKSSSSPPRKCKWLYKHQPPLCHLGLGSEFDNIDPTWKRLSFTRMCSVGRGLSACPMDLFVQSLFPFSLMDWNNLLSFFL